MTITSYLEAWFKIVTVFPKAMFMWNMSQVSLKGEKICTEMFLMLVFTRAT